MKCRVCENDIGNGRLVEKGTKVFSGLSYDLISCPYCGSKYELLAESDVIILDKGSKNFEKDLKIAERTFYAKKQQCSIKDVVIPKYKGYKTVVDVSEALFIVWLNPDYKDNLKPRQVILS